MEHFNDNNGNNDHDEDDNSLKASLIEWLNHWQKQPVAKKIEELAAHAVIQHFQMYDSMIPHWWCNNEEVPKMEFENSPETHITQARPPFY